MTTCYLIKPATSNLVNKEIIYCIAYRSTARDVILAAAALARGRLGASFCPSCSRLCLRSPLPRSCLGLEPSAFASARPRYFWPRHGLEVSASILLEEHELVTFCGFVVYLVHLAFEFSVLVVVNDRHYYCTIY